MLTPEICLLTLQPAWGVGGWQSFEPYTLITNLCYFVTQAGGKYDQRAIGCSFIELFRYGNLFCCSQLTIISTREYRLKGVISTLKLVIRCLLVSKTKHWIALKLNYHDQSCSNDRPCVFFIKKN